MYTFDEEGYKIKTGQCELKKVSSSSFSAGNLVLSHQNITFDLMGNCHRNYKSI
jgi:hypothetical protein